MRLKLLLLRLQDKRESDWRETRITSDHAAAGVLRNRRREGEIFNTQTEIFSHVPFAVDSAGAGFNCSSTFFFQDFIIFLPLGSNYMRRENCMTWVKDVLSIIVRISGGENRVPEPKQSTFLTWDTILKSLISRWEARISGASLPLSTSPQPVVTVIFTTEILKGRGRKREKKREGSWPDGNGMRFQVKPEKIWRRSVKRIYRWEWWNGIFQRLINDEKRNRGRGDDGKENEIMIGFFCHHLILQTSHDMIPGSASKIPMQMMIRVLFFVSYKI